MEVEDVSPLYTRSRCRHRRRVGSGLPKRGLNPPVAGNGLGIPPFNPPGKPAGLVPGIQ